MSVSKRKKEMLGIPHPELHAVDILIQIHPDFFLFIYMYYI